VTLDRFQPYEIPSDDAVVLRLCFVKSHWRLSQILVKDDPARFHGHPQGLQETGKSFSKYCAEQLTMP
jgi:hypothetical protein